MARTAGMIVFWLAVASAAYLGFLSTAPLRPHCGPGYHAEVVGDGFRGGDVSCEPGR